MNIHPSQQSALLLRAAILFPNTQGSYEPAVQFFSPGSEISLQLQAYLFIDLFKVLSWINRAFWFNRYILR